MGSSEPSLMAGKRWKMIIMTVNTLLNLSYQLPFRPERCLKMFCYVCVCSPSCLSLFLSCLLQLCPGELHLIAELGAPDPGLKCIKAPAPVSDERLQVWGLLDWLPLSLGFCVLKEFFVCGSVGSVVDSCSFKGNAS